jgi:uridine monophosphate synthetase
MTANIITELYDTILNENVLVFKPYTLKNGSRSEYYFNIKNVYSNNTLMESITDVIVSKINKLNTLNTLNVNVNIQHIVGVPYGALPIATLISSRLNKSLLFVRKETKLYGVQNNNNNNKVIEGKFQLGDEVILIEDVCTTGSSIIETVKKLENVGVIVSGIIVLFDRETSALTDLQSKLKIPIESVLKISKLINYYSVKKMINEFDLGKLISSLAIDKKNYINLKNSILYKEKQNDKHILSVKNYDYIFERKFSFLMMGIIIYKKTPLCLSLDVSEWNKAKKILDIAGPYICMVKLHCDLFIDIDCVDTFIKELRDLARKHTFLIMEDIKVGDVDKITYNKLTNGFYKINEWANLVTIQGLNAIGCYKYYCDKNGIDIKTDDETDDESEKENEDEEDKEEEAEINSEDYFNNFCLVSDMNQTETLLDNNYKQECVNILNNNKSFSECVISQNGTKIVDRIKLTPGIHLEEMDKIGSRCYRNIKTALCEDKNHIIIVGNGILKHYKEDKSSEKNKDDFIKNILNYRNIGWYYFEHEYSELINKYSNQEEKVLTIFKNVFSLTELETNLIKRESNYNKRIKEITLKDHEIIINQNKINKDNLELIINKNDFLFLQGVCYSLFMMLTVVVNYKTILDYLIT